MMNMWNISACILGPFISGFAVWVLLVQIIMTSCLAILIFKSNLINFDRPEFPDNINKRFGNSGQSNFNKFDFL